MLYLKLIKFLILQYSILKFFILNIFKMSTFNFLVNNSNFKNKYCSMLLRYTLKINMTMHLTQVNHFKWVMRYFCGYFTIDNREINLFSNCFLP